MFFSLTAVAALYTIQLRTFHPNKTVNKKKRRFLYYIQAKCGDIADQNPNAVDEDELSIIDGLKYTYVQKNPNERKYQLLINKSKSVSLKHCNDSKAFIEYSNDMKNIYENIDEYNPNKKRKILTVFDIIADSSGIKNLIQ